MTLDLLIDSLVRLEAEMQGGLVNSEQGVLALIDLWRRWAVAQRDALPKPSGAA